MKPGLARDVVPGDRQKYRGARLRRQQVVVCRVDGFRSRIVPDMQQLAALVEEEAEFHLVDPTSGDIGLALEIVKQTAGVRRRSRKFVQQLFESGAGGFREGR